MSVHNGFPFACCGGYRCTCGRYLQGANSFARLWDEPPTVPPDMAPLVDAALAGFEKARDEDPKAWAARLARDAFKEQP